MPRLGAHPSWSGLSRELGPLFRLAVPVVCAELGWMAMGLIDTMMVGRVGAEAIGAVSIGGTLFFAHAVFGMGVLLGLDYTVAHAYGAGRLTDAHRALFHGIYLSVLLSALLTGLIHLATPILDNWGLDPAVREHALPYLRAVTWGLWPLLLYACLRRYLQALGQVHAVMIALVTANVIHVAVNWVLIFGHLGAPALGAEGAGWATTTSRVYMCAVLAFAVWRYDRGQHVSLRHASRAVEAARLWQLLRLGFPAAIQVTLEVGVFAAATMLAGRLAPSALAAHTIATNVASFTFMVPLGVSSAAAVRVGHALGRGDPSSAAVSGWASVLLGATFMLSAGVALLLVPETIMRVFTTDEAVIAAGIRLLGLAALFQLFDGIQVVATGVLRGTGETRTPMLANLVGHWCCGLPTGYLLCFRFGWGVQGLWIGLSVGLIAVAVTLLSVWTRRARALVAVKVVDDRSTPHPDGVSSSAAAAGTAGPATSDGPYARREKNPLDDPSG